MLLPRRLAGPAAAATTTSTKGRLLSCCLYVDSLLRPRQPFCSSSGGHHAPRHHRFEFDEAMALEPCEGGEEAGSTTSRFRGHVTDQWSFGDAPNGGILTSLAISAARQAAGVTHKDPLSVSTHFVRKARENAPAVLRVRRLAAARSQETVAVSLLQPDEGEGEQDGGLVARAHFLMTLGTLGRFKGMDMNLLAPPALPPREACIDVMAALRRGEDGGDGSNYRIADRLELHVARDAPFVSAAFGTDSEGVDPHEPCVLEGWARLRDGRWPCLRSMALFNDGFPAPIHSHAMRHHKPCKWVWVPTLELTTHFWERPPKRGPEDGERPAPYLRLRFATAFVRRGLLMCDSEVWDAARPTLYSSSRQYARLLVPRPPEAPAS